MSADLSLSSQSHLAFMSEIMADHLNDAQQQDRHDVAQVEEGDDLKQADRKKGRKIVSGVQQSKGSMLQRQSADKASVRSFHWERNAKGEFEMATDMPEPFITSINKSQSARHMLRVMGMKVDVSDKVNTYKETYMKQFIQSRSPNFFLSRFSMLKCGFTGQILSLLGVTSIELQKLQKQALGAAREENLKLMSENVYNIELCELVYGRTNQAKQSLRILQEMERQLVDQMRLLGKDNYWTKLRLLEERMYQCKRIKEEFLKEASILRYQLDHLDQGIES